MKWGSFLALSLSIGCLSNSFAATIENLDALTSTAKTFVEASLPKLEGTRYQVIPGKLDPRLRLAKCDYPIETFIAPGSQLKGNTTVGLRCVGNNEWSIYLPVRIAIYTPVIVASNRLERGEIISAHDLETAEIDVSSLRSEPIVDIQQALGSKMKKSLSKGQVIDSNSICLICKGDLVTINAGSNQVVVQVAGTALSDGARGEKIRVQNNESKRIIEALVLDNSQVIVN